MPNLERGGTEGLHFLKDKLISINVALEMNCYINYGHKWSFEKTGFRSPEIGRQLLLQSKTILFQKRALACKTNFLAHSYTVVPARKIKKKIKKNRKKRLLAF